MKPKTLLLMSVAIVCGLGASYMTSRMLADRHDEIEKVRILVAKRQLNMGDPIKVPQDMFEEREYLKDQEPRDALVKFDDIKGRTLKKALRAGDFIRVEDLLDSRDGSLPANLPHGFRAVGQRVTMEGSASGFVVPFSRVDVVQTVNRGDDPSASIILQNVLVIAVGEQTLPSEGGRAMPAAVVTFAVSPEDGLKLHLAREVGTLSLMLRKTGDPSESPVTRVGAADLKKSRPTAAATQETDVEPAPAIIQSLPFNFGEAKPAEVVTELVRPEDHVIWFINGTEAHSVAYSRSNPQARWTLKK